MSEKEMEELLDEDEAIRQLIANGAYVSRCQISTCNVCKQKKDLRMGACFECSDYIHGKDLGDGRYLLWDSRNHKIRWIAKS